MSAAGFGGDAPVLVSAALLKERVFKICCEDDLAGQQG